MSVYADFDRLQRIAETLPAADELWFLETFIPHSYRSKLRDTAIRDAVAKFFLEQTCNAAKALARALLGYRASHWAHDRDLRVLPDGASERHVALHRILRLNKGRALAWRQLVEIIGDAETAKDCT